MADAKKADSSSAVRDVKQSDGPTPPGDAEGKITNRPAGEGTVQTEPTPEELPSDAKIAPVLEQQAPNQAALAVGANTVEGEAKKIVDSDMSSASDLIPDESNQKDAAKRSEETARLRSEEGRG